MAGRRCGRMMNGGSISSIRSAVRSNLRSSSSSSSSSSSPKFSLPKSPSPAPRFSFSRIPSELGCAMSMLPLHSAVSTARMTSCLSTSCSRALSQGTLCRTYPGL